MNESLKKLVESLVSVLEMFAASTTTKIDDAGVQVLKAILASDLLSDWFALEFVSGAPCCEVAEVPNEVQEAFTAAGITGDDLGTFLTSVAPRVRDTVAVLT